MLSAAYLSRLLNPSCSHVWKCPLSGEGGTEHPEPGTVPSTSSFPSPGSSENQQHWREFWKQRWRWRWEDPLHGEHGEYVHPCPRSSGGLTPGADPGWGSRAGLTPSPAGEPRAGEESPGGASPASPDAFTPDRLSLGDPWGRSCPRAFSHPFPSSCPPPATPANTAGAPVGPWDAVPLAVLWN